MQISERLLAEKIKKQNGLMTDTVSIPKFQRDATWHSDKTVKLWESISEYVQTVDSNKRDHFFYLGNLVTHEKRKIVDGQQRLNALTIICSAFRDVLLHLGKPGLAWKIHHDIVQNDGKNWRYKLNEKNVDSTKAMNVIREPCVMTNLDSKITAIGNNLGTTNGWTEYEVSVKGKANWAIIEGSKLVCDGIDMVTQNHIYHNTDGTWNLKIPQDINPEDLVGKNITFGKRLESTRSMKHV